MSRTHVHWHSWLAAAARIVAGMLITCSRGEDLAGGASETGNTSVGMLQIEAFDAPPPQNVEKLLLDLKSVQAHHIGLGWQTVSTTPRRIDFLTLINGRTAVIADTTLPMGQYGELRLHLGENNEIVVDGERYPLVVPSGLSSGVKIHLSLEIVANESSKVYLDFDASKSVKWNANRYKLAPSFSAYDASTCGRISGLVRSDLGAFLPRTQIQAIGTEDTLSTLNDENGNYSLLLPSGTYDIVCETDQAQHVDTTYHGIAITEGAEVVGLDFNVW